MLSQLHPAPSHPRGSRRTWLAAAILLATLPLALLAAMQAFAAGSGTAIAAALLAAGASLALALLLAGVAVRRLAHDARLQAASANAAGQAGDDMLGVLSHELRTPLAALSAAAQVLERPGTQGETALEARAVIARQAHTLSHMLNELSDLSRLVAGKTALARQPFDLAAMLQRLLQDPALTGAGHRLSGQLEPAWVQGDAARLEQALTRLLTDALRSAPAGREVLLSSRREGGFALALVDIDRHGIGNGADNAGIGLMLARRLAQLHGGTLEANATPQGGRFILRLPAAEPAAAGRPAPPQGRRKVLVMAAGSDALAALRAGLELDGHAMSVSEAVQAGLGRLLQERPDACIVDIAAAGSPGLDLARQARAHGYAGWMIALCGAEADTAAAMAAGFDACLAKPLDEAQLRASVLRA